MTGRWDVVRRSACSRTWLLGLCLLMAGCSVQCEQSGNQDGISGSASVSIGAGSESNSATGGLAIDFRSEPDPPKSGSNEFEVVVKGADGKPVSDASVNVVFSMPAMPSMNMPAMRSETTLAHDADGRYKGTGDISMAGTWNVKVTVSRGSEEVGERDLSIVAK